MAFGRAPGVDAHPGPDGFDGFDAVPGGPGSREGARDGPIPGGLAPRALACCGLVLSLFFSSPTTATGMDRAEEATANVALRTAPEAVPEVAPVDPNPRQRTIHLVALGSLEGQFEACGCQPEPRGGLARRAGALADLHKTNEPILHLDLGNFSETRPETRDFTNRFLFRTLAGLGLDAVAVGRRELQNWSLFDSLSQATQTPVVSTNVSRTDKSRTHDAGTRRLGRPTLVLERGGIRFGFVAVLDPLAISDLFLFHAEDPAQAIAAVLPALRRDVDIIVLLSQLSLSATVELLQNVDDIDIALCGQGPRTEEKLQVGKTVVQSSGVRGQYFGHLTLNLDEDGQIVSFRTESPPLDSEFPEDPLIAAEMVRARAALDRLRAEARRREQTEFNALFERWRSASK